jgi:hypothetical protein
MVDLVIEYFGSYSKSSLHWSRWRIRGKHGESVIFPQGAELEEIFKHALVTSEEGSGIELKSLDDKTLVVAMSVNLKGFVRFRILRAIEAALK